MSRLAKAIWFSILAPLLVGLVSFVAIAAWTHYHSTVSATQVRFFAPSPPYGVPVFHAAGSCFVDFSIADYGAPDAHRCFAGNSIYDPCFSQGSNASTTLVCALSPWTRQLVLLRVTRWMADQPHTFKVLTFPPDSPAIYRYVRRGSLRDNFPWALDLGRGIHCIFATGTADLVRGLRENYLCIHGDFLAPGWWKNAGAVLGLPNRSRALWRVTYLAPGGQSTRRVTLAAAWY